MIKKYIPSAILLTFLLFSLTGCYDAAGIEDFYYIVAIAIDKSDNDLITLSLQTAKTSNSSEGSSQQSNEYKIYSVDCHSIDEGINILDNYLNKQINLSHCSAIVFSEEIAKENIKEYVATFGNHVQIRPNCNIIISSQSAKSVLENVSNSGESFSARLYEYILSSVDDTGYTVDATLSNFLARINNPHTEALAIYCISDGNSIQNCGTAIFKGDIMIGTLTPMQTMCYLMLEGEIESCMIRIDNPADMNNSINLDLKTLKKPSIDVNLINNTPFVAIDLCIQGKISSAGNNYDYTSGNNTKIVEQKTNEYLENLMEDYLYTLSKNFNSDITTVQGYLSSKYLTGEEFQKVHWNEIFKDAYFDVTVHTQITSVHLYNKQ